MSATMGRLVCSPTDSARVRGGGFVVRSRVVVRSLDVSSFDGAMEPSAHRPRAHQPPGPAPQRLRAIRSGQSTGHWHPNTAPSGTRRRADSRQTQPLGSAPRRFPLGTSGLARADSPTLLCPLLCAWRAAARSLRGFGFTMAGVATQAADALWPLAARRRRHRSRRQHRRPEAPRLLGPWHAPESRGHAQLTGGCKCSRRIGASLAPSWAFDFFHTSMKF